VVESKAVEECLDGVIIRELRLDETVSEPFIRYLGQLGVLQYYPHFSRPFYRVTRKGEFIVKGVLGNASCQVFFINYKEESEAFLHDHITKFGS
jgi:hypothetical protein